MEIRLDTGNNVELRDYQQDLVDRTINAIDGSERPIISAPTGAGKSLVLAGLTGELLNRDRRIMICCHRREILLHLERTINRHLDIKADVISSDGKVTMDDMRAQVVIAMVPTLSRRKRKIPDAWRGEFSLLFDEGHHATADTWIGLRDHLQPRDLAGCTATVVSCNQRPLIEVYNTIIDGPEPQWLIDNGYLCRPVVYAADQSQIIDTKGVKIRGGDYVSSELSKKALQILGTSVDVWRELNPDGAPTLLACCDLIHAERAAEKFTDAGIAAAMVHGEMSIKERDSIIESFSKGNIDVLTFVSLIDEGMDIPSAAVCQFARPTRSIRLRRQLEGRVLRPHPSKDHAKIIDQTDSYKQLPFPNEAVAWCLHSAREEGAQRKGSKGRLEKVERCSESKVVERREVTPSEFREITRAASSWADNRPPLIQALESGDPAVIEECLRYRCSTKFGRSREVNSALAWDGLGSDHIKAIGNTFGWSSWWISKTIVSCAETRSKRALSTMRAAAAQGDARRALRNAIADAVAAGELKPQAVDTLELIGVLGGTELVIGPLQEVADRIEGAARLDAQKVLAAALASRVAPFSLQIGRLFYEPSRKAQALAAFD